MAGHKPGSPPFLWLLQPAVRGQCLQSHVPAASAVLAVLTEPLALSGKGTHSLSTQADVVSLYCKSEQPAGGAESLAEGAERVPA